MLYATKVIETICSNLNKYSATVTNEKNRISFKKTVTTQIENEEIVLFDGKIASVDTKFYAEGFQMLSQSIGTFSNIKEIGRCPDDREPYTKEQNVNYDYKEAYNYIILNEGPDRLLIGALTCNKYPLKFKIFNDGRLVVSMPLYDHANKIGSVIESEVITVINGVSNDDLLKQFSYGLNSYNRRLAMRKPTGWCSWYGYYENITEDIINENLNIMKNIDECKYVLIDDGYQKHIGDWLSFTSKFKNNLVDLISNIKASGKEPAIWVAPFIASGHSELFRNNKDFFAKNKLGSVLDSSNVTYGGWRDTPWYSLDFSHDGARNYIQRVFTYLHDVLGIRYYKLDACYWGAHKHLKLKKGITPIENYRLGLQSILEVIVKDSYLLGCNAPLWPSLGLVHAMRISDDVERTQSRFVQQLNELRHRVWMNQNLWINDPDCLCLHNYNNQIATKEDFKLHIATVLLANGSLFLGDSLDKITPSNRDLIQMIYEVQSDCCCTTVDDNFEIFTMQGNRFKTRIYLNLEHDEKIFDISAGYVDFFTREKVEGKRKLPKNTCLLLIKKN